MPDRRDHVPFDPRFFEKEALRGKNRSIDRTFIEIYESNHWLGPESVSGEGSSREQTRVVESAVPEIVGMIGARVLLDIPCGDFSWMRHVRLGETRYIGADIVPELIERNRVLHGRERRSFLRLDVTADTLPRADLVLCRDCLVHFSFDDIFRALQNIRRSGSTHLLTTTFPGCRENEDIVTGDWRPLNLQEPPLDFPTPVRIINEECTEAGGVYPDKSLGLWRVEDLPEHGA